MASDDKSGREARALPSPARVIMGTIGDTTWRMFGPTLIGIFGGHYLDERFGTAPYLLLAGIVFGACAAGILIWRQVRQ